MRKEHTEGHFALKTFAGNPQITKSKRENARSWCPDSTDCKELDCTVIFLKRAFAVPVVAACTAYAMLGTCYALRGTQIACLCY
eukprot:3940875-Rhodomonas_salina.3